MELPEGMVAVVRGIQDAALCVTLLDGARQYTLMPNPGTFLIQYKHQQPSSNPHRRRRYSNMALKDRIGTTAAIHQLRLWMEDIPMAHCNAAPTSPPVALTEFPPQKAELCPGHGNFEVGGLGSGEHNFNPTRISGSFRGGMSWPDRGSVCSPRASRSPDAFANSLRKYPNLSPERSAELVQRLINYTQLKNAKNLKSTSPSRFESVTQNYDRPSRSRSCCRRNEPEVITREESQTWRKTEETDHSRMYGRSYDVRYVKEVSRRVKENIKSFGTYPYSHPVCPIIKESYDHLPPQERLNVTHSVNMETQADIQMVSKEVTTAPRVQPSMRNVAVPLSPSSSTSDAKPDYRSIKAHSSSKSIQTAKALDLTLKIRKSVQTCFSSIDIKESRKIKNRRKSKSQEELRVNDDFEEEIVQLIQDLTSCPDLDKENVIRSRLLRKLRKAHKTDRSERVKIKIGRCIKDQLYSEIDLKNFTRELSNELISKIKRHNMFIGNNPTYVYRADLDPFKTNHQESCVDEIIKEWLNDIPIKLVGYLDRDVKKGHLLQNIANKVRNLIINKLKYNSDSTLTADIIQLIDDIPIDVSGHNKRFYLNRLVSELMKKIKDIFTPGHSRRRWRRASEFPYKCIQPTEKELRQFIREEITEFSVKFCLKICPETFKQIEIELTGILMDSIEMIRFGNTEEVKEEILGMLAEFVSISEHQAIYLTNNVIYNLKDIFDQSNCIRKPRSQTFVVLQNVNQEPSKNNTDFSIEEITQRDIDANLEMYTNQIVQQINEWSASIKGFDSIDSGYKQVVINDLAGDIVDRHKYLELNPSSKTTDMDEIEHLKYQIFKWINKVVGEYNLDTIERASGLMEKLKTIPVPMLTKPQQNGRSSPPSCCQKAGATIPNIIPEAVQSTSNYRRFSDPERSTPQKYENYSTDQIGQPSLSALTGEQFMNQSRRPGMSIAEKSCCDNSRSPNPDGLQSETTESRFNASMGVTLAPSKTSPSAAPAHNQMHVPPGPSVSLIEPPRNKAFNDNRRMSGPAGFLSAPMKKTTQPPNSGNAEELQSTYRLRSTIKSNKTDCCSSKGALSIETPSIKQLNDEYDSFVKHWVQQIPIATSSPTEEALAEKARLGIYNGIWKAITKLKMNPATMNNPFYYQDVFDDELEELLGFLPQSTDLTNKKHAMKAQLIEKTTNTNDLIVSAVGPSSYKQHLVETVSNNLPRNAIDYTGTDIGKLYEEMQKMNLAEKFILYIKYREEDRVKGNVFKKKLMKEVQELINSIKVSHGKELKDIDASAYTEEVIAALQKVPMPSEDTINEEADEINIGLEIEQWFSDLPLVPNDDDVERLGRRRFKDVLAKKIYDIEMQSSSLANSDNQIKEQVTHFLERMPLRPGETGNINFMVEELVNRLKNRPNDIVALGGERKKSVTFVDAYNYDDFSRDMPVCSSFSDMGRPAQANQSSYMIADGTRVKNNDPYERYVHQRDTTAASQQQWYSLEETRAPSGLKPPGLSIKQSTSPPCCRTLGEQNSLPRLQTTNQLPITYSSSSQTPLPGLTMYNLETHEGNQNCAVQNRSDSPKQLQQSSHRYEQAPQRYEQAFQRYEQTPQRYDQIPQRSGMQYLERHEQAPQTRLEYIPKTCSQGTATSNLDKPNPRTCETFCKSRHSSAPPSYRTEGATRPMTAQTPDCRTNPTRQFSDPISFSTPRQNISPQTSSRPKKRAKEVERSRREAARRKLDLDETEIDTEDEVRCRCMEQVWRCPRKKPNYSTCDDDFVPCYVRFPPHPYFF